jgi:hypothetical protein
MWPLAEIVARLDEFDETQTIYAAQPWTPDSPALVDREPEGGGLPGSASRAQLAYFLEINIAQQFIEDWKMTLNREPSSSELCRRLIAYAVNDA